MSSKLLTALSFITLSGVILMLKVERELPSLSQHHEQHIIHESTMRGRETLTGLSSKKPDLEDELRWDAFAASYVDCDGR